MPQPKLTDEILIAALEGYEAQKTRIDAHIAEIRSLLGGGRTGAASSEAGKPKRKVSASARRRMARAQKLRWKKIKQGSEMKEPAVKPKRHMSASARKRIAAAQKKRWAAVKKAAERPAVAKKATRKKATAAPEPSATAGA
jgi:hypothetical protein